MLECPQAAKQIAIVHGRNEERCHWFERPSGVPIVKVTAEFRQPLCNSECSFCISDELFQRRKTKILRRQAGIQQKPEVRWGNVMSYERGTLAYDVWNQPIFFRIAKLAKEPPGAQRDIPDQCTILFADCYFAHALWLVEPFTDPAGCSPQQQERQCGQQ